MSSKQFNISAVGSVLQLGKQGPTLEVVGDDILIPQDPVDPLGLVTKQYADSLATNIVKVRKVDFSYQTTSPFNIGDVLPNNAIIVSCRINISVPFNGITPTLSIGTATDNDCLATTAQITLSSSTLSFVNNYYDIGTIDKQLIGTLNISGSTTGVGSVLIEFYTAFDETNAGAIIINGSDGNSVLNGTVSPTTQGVDGDFYINTATSQLYGPKTSGVWGTPISLIGNTGPTGATGPQGDAGAAGLDGKTVLNGTIVPTTEGVDGDFYIRTTTSEIYGPKTSGSWGSPTSLVGPAGDISWQGTWVSQNYVINEAVYYQGSSYVCKLNTISNEVPTNATYWDLLAQKGETGVTGNSVLNGVGAPTTQGVDGDFYINTTNHDIYGPKTGGLWGSPTPLAASIDNAAPLDINEQIGTTYTVVASDLGKVIRFTSNSNITLTINADVATSGFNFTVEQAGTGQVTFAGTSTRVNVDAHTKTYGQYAMVSFICTTVGTFNFAGRTA